MPVRSVAADAGAAGAPTTDTAGDPASLSPADLAAVPAEVVDRLLRAQRVMTVCHRDPEADALGSALGLALALETLGKVVTPVCADPVPGMYAFMPSIERFRTDPDPDLDYDLIVVGDCGELERVGRVLDEHAALFGRVPIVDIDHHGSNRGFGAVDWIDPTAAATCEMVTLLLPHLGVPLDALDGDLAAVLMAGVVIDTATFAHPNATPRTLRVAAALRAAGAPLSDISRRLYRTKPAPQLRLFGRVLERLRSDAQGRVVWSTLLPGDLEAASAVPAMSEGIIDLLAQAEGAEVAILFKDQGERTRISVRTRDGGVDAIALTGAFGGGGHSRAAGATIEAPLASAQARVLALAGSLAAGVERAA
jgi:phosphoesterase RecJ-like protein